MSTGALSLWERLWEDTQHSQGLLRRTQRCSDLKMAQFLSEGLEMNGNLPGVCALISGPCVVQMSETLAQR
jgi:hypothetical protein